MKLSPKLYFALFVTLIISSSCTLNPNACFSVEGIGDLQNNDTIQFTNCSLRASSYYWDFGDGTTSTEISPEHVYESVGDYRVELIATSENGKKQDTRIQFVQVNLKPPTRIILNKVVLKNFSQTFHDPDIYMRIMLDTVVLLEKNQIHQNCKQGVTYTFDAGFPITFTGDELLQTTKIEFLSDKGSGNDPTIGYQNTRLLNSYYQYISSNPPQDSIRFLNGSLEIYLFPEYFFD